MIKLKPILKVNLSKGIRALGLSCIAIAPTGVILGLLAWFNLLPDLGDGFWYFMIFVHGLAFVATFVFVHLPEDKKWEVIKSFAGFAAAQARDRDPTEYDPVRSGRATAHREGRRSTKARRGQPATFITQFP